MNMWGPRVDTIITLLRRESIYIESIQDIGFPRDSPRLFREQPGIQNFSLLMGDSIINIDSQDKY